MAGVEWSGRSLLGGRPEAGVHRPPQRLGRCSFRSLAMLATDLFPTMAAMVRMASFGNFLGHWSPDFHRVGMASWPERKGAVLLATFRHHQDRTQLRFIGVVGGWELAITFLHGRRCLPRGALEMP